MSREDPQLRIRLPIELKEKIESSSQGSGRSMNAEIVSILGEHYKTEERQRDSMVVVLGRDLLTKHPEVNAAFYELLSSIANTSNDEDKKPT